MNEIGKRLRTLRLARGLSQRQIADSLPCNASLYSKYELGKRKLTHSLAVELAVFYQTSVDYIVCLTDDPVPHHCDDQ